MDNLKSLVISLASSFYSLETQSLFSNITLAQEIDTLFEYNPSSEDIQLIVGAIITNDIHHFMSEIADLNAYLIYIQESSAC